MKRDFEVRETENYKWELVMIKHYRDFEDTIVSLGVFESYSVACDTCEELYSDLKED